MAEVSVSLATERESRPAIVRDENRVGRLKASGAKSRPWLKNRGRVGDLEDVLSARQNTGLAWSEGFGSAMTGGSFNARRDETLV